MPLRDHFRGALAVRRHWHAFHNAWATAIAAGLNERLPMGYFAEPNVQFGIEIDVAAFEESGLAGPLPAVWTPPSPSRTVPLALGTDTVEVTVHATEGGPTLAGAVELVSPANKDRREHRDAFVAKCETYLRQGVGLVVVDVVTSRRADLHGELLRRLELSEGPRADLLVTSYRPRRSPVEEALDLWEEPVEVGGRLPDLPLWLRGGLCVAADLEGSYERTCRELRIPAVAQPSATGS